MSRATSARSIRAAKKRLDQGHYKEAAALFDEVERQHPYSIWARRAQLMSAFSYYLDRDYTQSIQSAQRFLSVHPGNRDAPYAYYLIALSYYEQISDVTRDQKITRQALDALGELTRRYPNTRYAADARLKIDLVRDHLAGKEMEIGRFYETRGQWLAATMRFRNVDRRVPDDDAHARGADAADRDLSRARRAEEAKKSAAVLGANYPGTDWYERAYKLMQRASGHSRSRRSPPASTIDPARHARRAAASLPGDAGTATPKAEAPAHAGSPTGGAGSGAADHDRRQPTVATRPRRRRRRTAGCGTTGVNIRARLAL